MQSRPVKTYFVYIVTNRSKTLYTGVTNNLVRRVREHKEGIGSRFALKYKLDRLVYFERFEDIRNAKLARHLDETCGHFHDRRFVLDDVHAANEDEGAVVRERDPVFERYRLSQASFPIQ